MIIVKNGNAKSKPGYDLKRRISQPTGNPTENFETVEKFPITTIFNNSH
ncbi:MAG: hypothetical protein ACMG51_02210 [Ginsengibacter sp.]